MLCLPVRSAPRASPADQALPAALGAQERPANAAAIVAAPTLQSSATAPVTGGRRMSVTAVITARMQHAQVGCSADGCWQYILHHAMALL
jgi:hypothetical protein